MNHVVLKFVPLLLGAALLGQDTVTAFRGARILPGGVPAIDNGVLVIAQGKVQAIGGANTAIPDGARIVDLTGRTITPGLIDVDWHSGVGAADLNEDSDEITPHLKIVDVLDPQAMAFARVRRGGVTTVQMAPGNRNVIGGMGAVLKTGGPIEQRLVKDESMLRLCMGSEPSSGNRAIRGGNVDSIYYRRPTTRMGVVWAARKAFFDAQEYQQRTVDAGGALPKDPGMEVLVRVLQKQLVAYTTARAEQDIRTALRIAAEFGYQTALADAADAWLCVDELAAAKCWVIVGAPSADSFAGAGGGDGAEPRWSTLPLLAQKGVPFVIATGSNARALSLRHEATFAVRFGLSRELALDAVTVLPARLLGVDERIGALQPGKDADFVVWTADPFDPTAETQSVHIQGLEIHEPR